MCSNKSNADEKIDKLHEEQQSWQQGRQTGGGVGGVSTPPPPLNFGWGVEHLSTPPDFEKIYFTGGLTPLKLI